MDAVGSSIRVDSRGREVMRILPRVNEAVNEEWITDKTRHVVDGLRLQRLDRPVRARRTARLRPATWQEAFAAIAGEMKAAPTEAHRRHRRRSCGGRGDLRAEAPDAPPRRRRTSMPGRTAPMLSPAYGRASYLFNSTIAGIEERGRHPHRRREPAHRGVARQCAHPQALAHGAAADRLIGEQVNLTYPYDYLGAGPETLADLVRRAVTASSRSSKGAETSARHRRAGRAQPRRTALRCSRWRRSSPGASAR